MKGPALEISLRGRQARRDADPGAGDGGAGTTKGAALLDELAETGIVSEVVKRRSWRLKVASDLSAVAGEVTCRTGCRLLRLKR